MAKSMQLVFSLVCYAISRPIGATTTMRSDDRCPHVDLGTTSACPDKPDSDVLSKEDYYKELKDLDIKALYDALAALMIDSQSCWPADGPQDGDTPSYAGLWGRLAWHCSGTFRQINNTGKAIGGCEGGRQRYWPENEWRDNVNLDKARALLGPIKEKFKGQISWSDLMTFAGTVGIKASGGPAKKFCFGRVDDADGSRSVMLGVEGTSTCEGQTTDTCENSYQWAEQDESDHSYCNLTQPAGRKQASHSVGLIYVFPEGPQLKASHPEFKSNAVHNRFPLLSGLEVRETFVQRMGWTDQETVALVGGGHTLGRTHGNCDLAGTDFAGYNGKGPYFEAKSGSGSGPTDGTCGSGDNAGKGANTVSSGFDGAWTRTPSKWNYDYFEAMIGEAWEAVKSPSGNDQWQTENRDSKYAGTRRLTADMSIVTDDTFREVALKYALNHAQFDSDFADAWFKLIHRSEDHPHKDDLEKDANVCTDFSFVHDDIVA